MPLLSQKTMRQAERSAFRRTPLKWAEAQAHFYFQNSVDLTNPLRYCMVAKRQNNINRKENTMNTTIKITNKILN